MSDYDFLTGYIMKQNQNVNLVDILNLGQYTDTGNNIILSWTNPTSSHWLKTIIMREENTMPVDPLDTNATIVYTTNSKTYNTYKDTTRVAGKTYCYKAFAFFDLPENEASARPHHTYTPIVTYEAFCGLYDYLDRYKLTLKDKFGNTYLYYIGVSHNIPVQVILNGNTFTISYAGAADIEDNGSQTVPFECAYAYFGWSGRTAGINKVSIGKKVNAYITSYSSIFGDSTTNPIASYTISQRTEKTNFRNFVGYDCGTTAPSTGYHVNRYINTAIDEYGDSYTFITYMKIADDSTTTTTDTSTNPPTTHTQHVELIVGSMTMTYVCDYSRVIGYPVTVNTYYDGVLRSTGIASWNYAKIYTINPSSTSTAQIDINQWGGSTTSQIWAWHYVCDDTSHTMYPKILDNLSQ